MSGRRKSAGSGDPEPVGPAEPEEPDVHEVTEDPEDVEAYWTEERMRSAKPAPMPTGEAEEP
jgi:hypothetical protein